MVEKHLKVKGSLRAVTSTEKTLKVPFVCTGHNDKISNCIITVHNSDELSVGKFYQLQLIKHLPSSYDEFDSHLLCLLRS